jgi:hypothetical protein
MGNRSHTASSVNFVYTYPNITLLASFVMDTIHGSSGSGTSNAVEAKITKMKAMVEEFTSFPVAANGAANVRPNGATTEQVLLLTGTTGGLGSHILRDACENEEVVRVYAFNRPQKKGSLAQRQRDVLREHGLDESIVDNEKVVLLEGDLTAENFGLEESVYKEVRNLAHLNSSKSYLNHFQCYSWLNPSHISSTTVCLLHCLFYLPVAHIPQLGESTSTSRCLRSGPTFKVFASLSISLSRSPLRPQLPSSAPFLL